MPPIYRKLFNFYGGGRGKEKEKKEKKSNAGILSMATEWINRSIKIIGFGVE